MVAATLDGQALSLELPADCISLAQVASYAKRDLGAAWADACVLPSSEPYLQRLQCVTHFDGKTLSGLQNNIGRCRCLHTGAADKSRPAWCCQGCST